MREGSLEAPTRHPIAWKDPDFYDEEILDSELRRVFDICHGCRRCFNLCDSFLRLFDLIDDSESGELDTVASADFKPVIDACTLCDMCFLTKCPYVPPHDFNLDFPHLMARARAVQLKKGEIGWADRQLTETDRNGKLGCGFSGITNWASKCGNTMTRPVMESMLGIHRDAVLPRFESTAFTKDTAGAPPAVNDKAPAFGRKAVLYATCFTEYNNAAIGHAARAVLAHNGVETEVVYPACCGMPQLEHGDLARVADSAAQVAAELKPWIDKGYDVIATVPSCALMMKFEWPLIVPDNADVKTLSEATFNITEYMMLIAGNEGLAEGLSPLDGGVTIHVACHARAQNMGQKGAEMLKQIPDTDIKVIERCSGHGGSWGVRKENFEVGIKVGRPVARQAKEAASAHVVSECPLARDHILQGMERQEADTSQTSAHQHPIQLLAQAYGL